MFLRVDVGWVFLVQFIIHFWLCVGISRVGWAYPHNFPFRSGVALGVHLTADLATLLIFRTSSMTGFYLSHVVSHVKMLDHVCLQMYKDSGKRPWHHKIAKTLNFEVHISSTSVTFLLILSKLWRHDLWSRGVLS